MIEDALRRQLRPIIKRRKRVHLATHLALCWWVAGLAVLALVGADWLWGWRSSLATGALGLATLIATAVVVFRSRRLEPDYQAVARNIEQHHPDLRALLLAAVEQKPQGPDGQMGYLQKQVLREALVHAADHDWLQSISTPKIVLADVARIAALLFLILALSQTLPPISLARRTTPGGFLSRGEEISVTPGDIAVESGTPVVVLARFDDSLPAEVSLMVGPPGEEPEEKRLTRSLDDPVFGGIIRNVTSNLRYHIRYEGKRTRDYAIEVFELPELTRIDAAIVYPAYTGLPEKLVEDTRRVSVVEGSEVSLTFTLNKPVTSARLAPRAGIALGLSVDDDHPNVLFTSITAAESERYQLHLSDAQGRTNKMPPRFALDVHKNLPPEITPVFPNRDVVASPLEELTLEAEVADDYGATGYGLTYTLAGSESQSIALGEVETAVAKSRIRHVLALENLGAEPDQLLTYYFWADDLGPNGQPRRTASDIYFAEVRPFEEIFRESQSQANEQSQNQGQQQQNGQADELARLQKQIITATWNIKQQVDLSGRTEETQGDLDVVRQSQSEALEQAKAALSEAEDPTSADALEAATGHMETALDRLAQANASSSGAELTPALGAEQSAYQELLKLRQREHQVARGQNAGRSASANSSRSQQQLQQLELTQEENRYETQRMAQSREQETQREDLQVLNRLRELARRQNEMSERLREAQAALREAESEQQREEILRELRRLRDEQLEAMRDMDELQQRMETPENRQRMADARERLDDSREQIRQSTEQLEQGMVSRAITSTTRAGRQLDEMRDEFRQRTSSQLGEAMRDLRDEAQELDERQQNIAEEIREQIDSRQKRLTGSEGSSELAEQIDQQQQRMEEMIDQMRDLSERSETSEPLVSRKLYDTLRQASTGNVDQALETTSELLRRNFLPQAQEVERQASEGIQTVRRGVEEAAESVLGDETEALRLARQQIDELMRQVDEEASRAGNPRQGQQAAGQPQDGRQTEDPNGAGQQGSPRDGGRAQNNETRTAQAGRPGGQGDRPGRGEQPQDAEMRTAQGGNPTEQGNQPNPGGQPQQDGEPRTARAGGRRQQGDPAGFGGGQVESGRWEDVGERGPLTGQDYREWSDSLRDVEEMLTEQELREEIARVRDRAKGMRAEFVRHGKEPQWDLVRSQIMKPLAELRVQIGQRLAQLQSDDALVPIDRDPVPERYAEVVREYFENLGEDD